MFCYHASTEQVLPGTITLKDGDTQKALVKFNSWKNTPEKISFKLTENGNNAPFTGADFARIELSERNSLYGGLGFSNDKFNIETRFGFGREVLSKKPEFQSKYTSLALIFGFKL